MAVLRLLKQTDLSEWQIMDSLYRLFGTAPDWKAFRTSLELLTSQGFLEVKNGGEARQLRVSKAGIKLLSALEKEYDAIVLKVGESHQLP